MKYIIDISEDVLKRTTFYREFRDLNDCVTILKALEKATPLPKGHGDLIDSGDAIETLQIMFSKDEDIQNACEQCILDCPIIIEADKGE